MPVLLHTQQSQDAFTAIKVVPQAQLLSLCGCSISPEVRYLCSVPSVHQKTHLFYTWKSLSSSNGTIGSSGRKKVTGMFVEQGLIAQMSCELPGQTFPHRWCKHVLAPDPTQKRIIPLQVALVTAHVKISMSQKNNINCPQSKNKCLPVDWEMNCLLYRASVNGVIWLCVQKHDFPSANSTKNSFAEAFSHIPSRHGAEVQKQGEGEASFSSSNSTAHSTHCSTDTTHSLRGSHCFPYPQPHSSPRTLGLLLFRSNAH